MKPRDVSVVCSRGLRPDARRLVGPVESAVACLGRRWGDRGLCARRSIWVTGPPHRSIADRVDPVVLDLGGDPSGRPDRRRQRQAEQRGDHRAHRRPRVPGEGAGGEWHREGARARRVRRSKQPSTALGPRSSGAARHSGRSPDLIRGRQRRVRVGQPSSGSSPHTPRAGAVRLRR